MGAYTYADDGSRVPFDPQTADLAGCLLCSRRRIAMIGVFVPATDQMRSVVLRLRQHPSRASSTACLAYGLCRDCAGRASVLDEVEAAIEAAAERVTLQ
jgi:hypothetical protein